MKTEAKKNDYWLGETIALLALSSIHGVGYWTVYKLFSQEKGFKQILQVETIQEFRDTLKEAGCKSTNSFKNKQWPEWREELWAQGNKIYTQLKEKDVKVLHLGEKQYPESLAKIADPPKWLFVQGTLENLYATSIAIVGTRRPTCDGKFLANYVGACLKYFEVAVVSGLANGIDQLIHKDSLRYNKPNIAVLGTGIFEDYPAGSEQIREEILQRGGTIVTEYLPNQGYSAENFVRRNRIQAGLASIVIPVEWKMSSGTAHTVKFAFSYKKDVVCLRLPDWNNNHKELTFAKEKGALVFTIPGNESLFFEHIKETLNTAFHEFVQLQLGYSDVTSQLDSSTGVDDD